ncbi:hypothetical protein MJH12_01550, partial [bacterium]|nr:hypothetical protein [bacterium]
MIEVPLNISDMESSSFDTWSKTLRSIVINHTHKSGKEYIDSVLLELSKVLQAEHLFVGIPVEEDPSKIRTLSYYAHYELVDNFVYDLATTPCENVIGRELQAYTCKLGELFPQDQIIVDLGLESYLGIPLFNS